MASFKVGDRVKRIENPHPLCEPGVGHIGTVCGWDAGCVGVMFDEYGYHGCYAWTLAPLTDPKADAFLESIRKLKPLHEEPKVREYDINGVRWTVTDPERINP